MLPHDQSRPLNTTHGDPLLIAGASVRAAAASALRAGYRPWCVDLFGDVDLARACPVSVVPLDEHPKGFLAPLTRCPAGPWMYTGGVENYPALVAQPQRELWGNGPEVLRAVRDPVRVAQVLQAAGLMTPLPLTTASDAVQHGRAVRWLRKPRRGSGGMAIDFWSPDDAFDSATSYLQEWVEGDPASAVFLGDASGQCHLLGATRQIIAPAWLHAPEPFQYAGTIGPLFLGLPLQATLETLGQTLVRAFGLRGLFGVDLILDGDRIWTVEVNPRYPASLEVLERATMIPYLRHHACAFRVSAQKMDSLPDVASGSSSHAKAVLFASKDLVFPGEGPWLEALEYSLDDLRVPYADLPTAGQRIERGQPVLTMFTSGPTADFCLDELRKIADDLDHVLHGR